MENGGGGLVALIAHDGAGQKRKKMKQTRMTSLPFTNDRLPLNEGRALSSAWKRKGR